jgi:E3 SUMO-protein ligase PIAS1
MCPIEFPPTCEIRVNGTALNANTKGLKKKPGTAPPCDLGKTVKPAAQNRVEMVYINSNASSAAGQAGSAPKVCRTRSLHCIRRLICSLQKYYIVVILVEMTSVDQLVDRLKKGKYRDSESILSASKRQVHPSNAQRLTVTYSAEGSR